MRYLIIILLMGLVLVSGCSRVIPHEEIIACETNDQCIVALEVGCCKCPIAINKKYFDHWQALGERSHDCSNILCEPCEMGWPEAKCYNNKCILFFEKLE